MNKHELINQSIDYIIQHFGENISVLDVAEHFHFSEFYFSRLFKAITGESVYAFIKRLKLDQSAVDIKLTKNKKITDIGLDYGYSSSNFSSAFRKHHRISPAEFRKVTNETSIINPFHPEKVARFSTFDDFAGRITIQEIEEMLVIYERIIGNYIELKDKWFCFIDRYSDYIKTDTLMVERFYNDPSITNLNQCICDLCMTVSGICKLDNLMTIKGGRFATYRFEGEIHDIFCTLQGIFSVWLPKSGYEMDERYGLNIYRKINQVNESVIMDLCIPIK